VEVSDGAAEGVAEGLLEQAQGEGGGGGGGGEDLHPPGLGEVHVGGVPACGGDVGAGELPEHEFPADGVGLDGGDAAA
jgi:hypothetical protein